MRAPIAPLALSRRTLMPTLLVLAMVAALSTPAGPRAEAGAAGRRSASPHAGTLRTDVIARGAAAQPAPVGGARETSTAAAPSEPYRPDPRDPAHPGIPPPHAPGYDDVKTWDDPPPRRAPSDATPVVATEAAAIPTGAVAWPVLPTSWQNRQLAASLPRPAELADLPAAAADFLRNGHLSWWAVQPAREAGAARLLLLERDAGGRWIDLSPRLLAGADDARVCARPRQLLVADFNRDERPDLYVVCDGEPHLAWLSRADGRYVRVDTGYAGWAGAAEAADVDGDGCVDIIATDDPRAAVLHGRGDGHFEARPR